MERELMSEDEYEQFRKEKRIKFGNTLRLSSLSDADRKLIEEGVRWWIYGLTMKKFRAELPKKRSEIMRGFHLNAKNAGPVRDFLLKEVTARASELLQGSNIHVRINAVVLLSQLTYDEGDSKRDIPARPYVPAGVPLLSVIKDDSQLNAVKINAVNGIARIARHGDPSNIERLEYAKTFVAELQKSDLHFWYQWRLVEGLGAIGISNDFQGNRPFVVQMLATILIDKQRDWLVRCEAARSLGRIPLNPDINVSLIAFEIINLTHQMAQAYNKTPATFNRIDCFAKLLEAFDERDGTRRTGLLERNSGAANVRPGYDYLSLMVQHLIATQRRAPFPTESMQKMTDFLKENQPENYRVAPSEPPLAVATPPADAATSATNVAQELPMR